MNKFEFYLLFHRSCLLFLFHDNYFSAENSSIFTLFPSSKDRKRTQNIYSNIFRCFFRVSSWAYHFFVDVQKLACWKIQTRLSAHSSCAPQVSSIINGPLIITVIEHFHFATEKRKQFLFYSLKFRQFDELIHWCATVVPIRCPYNAYGE